MRTSHQRWVTAGNRRSARIQSRKLDYSDADRRGDFRGDVTAQDWAGVIHAGTRPRCI